MKEQGHINNHNAKHAKRKGIFFFLKKFKTTRKSIQLTIVGLFAILLYAGTFKAPFIYDDISYITNNVQIRSIDNWLEVWTTSFPPHMPKARLYRPVTSLSFIVDYTISKLNPGGFHITNVILHVLATCLFYLILTHLKLPRFTPFLGGLFFAAHPVHTEAVSWIVGRAEILAALFCFLAVISWIKYCRLKHWQYLMITCLFYFFSLGAKESAAPLPAVLLLGDWISLFNKQNLLANVGRIKNKKKKKRILLYTKFLIRYLPFVLVFIIYWFLRVSALDTSEILSFSKAFYLEPAVTRFATGISSFFWSLKLLLIPYGLRIDYSDLIVRHLLDPQVLAGFSIILFLCVIAIKNIRKKSLITFCIGWFLFFLLITSHLVIEIGEVYAERFLYISSASICGFWAIILERLINKKTKSKHYIGILFLGILLAFYSVQTLKRNKVWQDEEVFYRTAFKQAPSSERIILGLATILESKWKATGQTQYIDEVIELCKKEIIKDNEVINSSQIKINLKLIDIYTKLEKYTNAITICQSLTNVLTKAPPSIRDILMEDKVFFTCGNLLLTTGDLDSGISVFKTTIQNHPNMSGAILESLLNSANKHLKENEFNNAVKLYTSAASILDSNPDIISQEEILRYKLLYAYALIEIEQIEAGIQLYKSTVKNHNNSRATVLQVILDRATQYYNQKQYNKASSFYKAGVEMIDEYPHLMSKQDKDQLLLYYNQVLEKSKNSVGARYMK
jgi:tetratricopeptide (TPR) repeat protein